MENNTLFDSTSDSSKRLQENYDLSKIFHEAVIKCLRATVRDSSLPFLHPKFPKHPDKPVDPECERGKDPSLLSLQTSALYPWILSHQEMIVQEDDGASRASTPSPTTYLNSLKPLDYQQYEVPTSSEQNDDLLFERQTDLLNQTQQMHKELRGGFKSFGKAL
ncbi:hypothetical protein Tco_0441982 [Tanacetum coccineum]